MISQTQYTLDLSGADIFIFTLICVLYNACFLVFSYKQRKFNLFREESEGFAKLITELNQDFNENISHKKVLDIVQSLIGKC